VKEPVGEKPPTHFRLNDLTAPFQQIVDTYGIARYREINPGLFTIATFPFLFGVMFGDIAHGGLLLVAGIYLICWKSKLEKEKGTLWNSMLPVRYLIFFMGLFAFYCGWIYNDFTSISFNAFGTCYEVYSKQYL
jgi:V-type H+-transporting ATPase subunit a